MNKTLDIGWFGTGLVDALKLLGYDSYGIYINSIPNQTSNYLVGNILDYTFEGLEKFDIMIAISTIEHVGLINIYGQKITDVDGDIHAVQRLRNYLDKEGYFAITIPYGKLDYPRYFARPYDDARIKRLTEGFKIIDEEYYMLKNSGMESVNKWVAALNHSFVGLLLKI